MRLFFFRGADLEDPDGRLEGAGAQVRSLKLPDLAVLDEPAVQLLMSQALQKASRPIDATQISRIVVNSATNTSTYREYRIDVTSVGSVRICDTRVSITSDDPRRCVLP